MSDLSTPAEIGDVARQAEALQDEKWAKVAAAENAKLKAEVDAAKAELAATNEKHNRTEKADASLLKEIERKQQALAAAEKAASHRKRTIRPAAQFFACTSTALDRVTALAKRHSEAAVPQVRKKLGQLQPFLAVPTRMHGQLAPFGST